MDLELREFFEDKFGIITSDIHELKQDLKSIGKDMREQSEKIIEAKKDIQHLSDDCTNQKNDVKEKFDAAFGKIREVDCKADKTKSKMNYWAGGIAAFVFIAGIIISILKLL